MGASGDMLMAALYELLPDKGAFRGKMEKLGLPGVTIEYSASTKCGITGTRIAVKVGGEEEKSLDVETKQGDGSSASTDSHGHNHPPGFHHHGDGHHHHHHGDGRHPPGHRHHAPNTGGRRYGYEEILSLIQGLDLPGKVLEDAIGVYKIIGEAEASVHGVPLSEIHLHEIGSLDAVADIVGCCLLVEMLGVTEVTASPVHVGSGSVRCEHGILPVPAPAAAEILKGIPIYGGRIKGELCTPTGAALLKRFVSRFGEMQPMTATKIGYGMGAKDFEAANCLRAFLCEGGMPGDGRRDTVFEISCNLDDMAPEAIGAAFGVLFENGALDVYATPILMKKNRPAVLLSCLCTEDGRGLLAKLMLEHTTTLGVRVTKSSRETLTRATKAVSTEYGDIRVKNAQGFGIKKRKPEYDDVLAAAKQHGVPFTTVHEAALKEERNEKAKEKAQAE
jgi:hypothetical protein